MVADGISMSVGALYEELQNPADEVYAFMKIRGAVTVVLNYIRGRI